MAKSDALRCQRIGCDAVFTDDDNPEGSCTYHESVSIDPLFERDILLDGETPRLLKGPIFHDGMKEWSCCKQRSHDFSLFLAIPGCKTGKHTTEKPVTKASPNPQRVAPVVVANKKAGDSCSRCRQGFFCSDHGSQGKPSKSPPPTVLMDDQAEKAAAPAPIKKVVDLNEVQTCRNKGCGKTFKEKDNHETACEYHPGPPVFHDRVRGWKCCDIHVKEFDEFIAIPPCTKGWHNANP